MKFALLIPVIAVLASSCRTVPPLDPMTMQPSQRCQPSDYKVKQ